MFFILVHLRLFVAVRHDFAKVYLKTKKMTDISQTQAGFCVCRTDDIFDVSDGQNSGSHRHLQQFAGEMFRDTGQRIFQIGIAFCLIHIPYQAAHRQIPIIIWPFPASFFQNIRNFLEILARLLEDWQHTVAMHHLRAGGHCIGNLSAFAGLLKVWQRTV